MRNLLGRLNARSTEELTRIAAAWQTPLAATERHAMVSRLYRALTDPRTARDCWDRLPADERAMVRLLAVSDETALTVRELATHLGGGEEEIRQIAARLYHKAIVAREGDDEPLPVGTLPRLFLPRELALLFRRVQDEIEAGDISETPVRALLALLDDREIEEAAETWGLRVIPGLRDRAELERQLPGQVGDPARIARVAASRRPDAAAIWARVRAEPDGAPVALDVAAAAAGLGRDDARAAQRRREALANLETALLVWHTYRADGSRWLFIPTEIRAPKSAAPLEIPPPQSIALAPDDAAGSSPSPADPPPFALAWDLLTVLRSLSSPETPAVSDSSEFRGHWARDLNARLWRRGDDLPPKGYLPFLLALARAEGLIAREDHSAAAAPVPAAIRLWRDRSFTDQMRRLLWWWQASQTWSEGQPLDDLDIRGAEWPAFRRALIARLASLNADDWYSIEEVSRWIAHRQPGMLGATVTVASGRQAAHRDASELDRRLEATAEAVSITLANACAWLGLVEVRPRQRRDRLFRLTPFGQSLIGGNVSLPEAGDDVSSPIVVTESDEVELRDPSPLRVWSLSAFATLDRLGAPARYHLTSDSVARALDAGFDIAQITSFLRQQTGGALPQRLVERLETWATSHRRLRLRRATVVSVDDVSLLPGLRELAARQGWSIIETERVVVIVHGNPDHDDSSEIARTLREAGYAPIWSAAPFYDQAETRPRDRAAPRPESRASGGAAMTSRQPAPANPRDRRSGAREH